MKQHCCKQEQKFILVYFLFCYMPCIFLGIKCPGLQGASVSYIFLCILQVKKEKKNTICLFIYLLVLGSGWSSTSLGSRGGGVSGKKLLLMSASSKLLSPCSPVSTVTGQKKNSVRQFFPLAVHRVVQLQCNFIMGCLYETNSSSCLQGKLQAEAGHGEGTTCTVTESPVLPHIIKDT